MKKTILLFALVLTTVLSVKAQKLKRVDTVDLSMTYKQMKKKFKSILFVEKSITLKDGSKLSIGDEVKFGNSSSKLINRYEHIYQGKMLNIASAMMGTKVINLRQEIISTANWYITEIRLTRTMGNIEVLFEANAKGLKGIGKKFQDKYTAEDDTFKITNFVVESGRLKARNLRRINNIRICFK